MQLYYFQTSSKRAVETTDVTKSFGWDSSEGNISLTDISQMHLIRCMPNFDMHVFNTKCSFETLLPMGVQGWCSGESTRLPPMWPGFDSQTRRRMWVEFVGSLLCTERFSLICAQRR